MCVVRTSSPRNIETRMFRQTQSVVDREGISRVRSRVNVEPSPVCSTLAIVIIVRMG